MYYSQTSFLIFRPPSLILLSGENETCFDERKKKTLSAQTHEAGTWLKPGSVLWDVNGNVVAMQDGAPCMTVLTCCARCAPFSNGLLTFSCNLFLTLESLDDTCDNENKFMIAEATQTSHTHTQDRCPYTSSSYKPATSPFQFCIVLLHEWIKLPTMDDGTISIKGLRKVTFKLVPVWYKATYECMDCDWWRPSLKNTEQSKHKEVTS